MADVPAALFEALAAFARAAYPRYVDDLRALVEIESGTGDVEGSAAIARLLGQRLAALGAAVETHANARGTHVVGRLAGRGAGRYVWLMHTDTVYPRGSLARQPFRVDESGRAFGPGAGDSKASAAFALFAAEALVAVAGSPFGELALYFDAEEEGGSDDEVALVEGLARAADVAMVLDTARPAWGIVARRKGLAGYRLDVRGLAGHAGNAAHASASATLELVHQLHAIASLASPPPGDPRDFAPEALAARGVVDRGQLVPDVTVNVGAIGSSNDRVNVVTDHAWAEIEVRAWTRADLARVDAAIRARAARVTVPGTAATVTAGLAYPPLEMTGRAAEVVARYKAIVRAGFGAEVAEWSAGGVTVGNFTAAFAPTVDALAVEMRHEHDLFHEHADLSTFGPRLVALAALVAAEDAALRGGDR